MTFINFNHNKISIKIFIYFFHTVSFDMKIFSKNSIVSAGPFETL